MEVQQYSKVGSFSEYISDFWNMIDCIHITVLLVSLLLQVVIPALFGDHGSSIRILESCLALNLLPSYVRMLQTLMIISEYFGTLLNTVFYMVRDAAKFLILLSIFCFAFSCALTPILWPTWQERWNQGFLWAFWTLFGEVNESAREKVNSLDSVLLRSIAYGLLYMLSLLSNVLLVNLLIAVMNSTYENTKAESEVEWAFGRCTAVFEFDDTASLPPPLNLFVCGCIRRNDDHDQDHSENVQQEKQMRRARSKLNVSQRDLKDAKVKALAAVALKLDTKSDEGRSELQKLREENDELKAQIEELTRENSEARGARLQPPRRSENPVSRQTTPR